MTGEGNQADKIIVLEKLTAPHPLVVLTRNVLTQAKPDDNRMLRPWGQKYLDIRVSPDSLRRALRIMDALLKAFEKRGFKVGFKSEKSPECYALIYDYQL